MSPAQYALFFQLLSSAAAGLKLAADQHVVSVQGKVSSSTEISIELPATDLLNCWVQVATDV